LRELFEVTGETMYQGAVKRWRGYRLFATDGSKINLPNDPQLREYFGTIGAGNGSPWAQGSVLYDIENDLVADARIERWRRTSGRWRGNISGNRRDGDVWEGTDTF
jgi:hypothetical protein